MTGKLIKFARYILETIAKVGSIKRPAPLSYSNLLTLVLKHFGVCLIDELQETKPVPVIPPISLKNIQFSKLPPESGNLLKK